MDSPVILYLKRNSLDDGPGIRTTIFFKGCPLSCDWCHNPESRSTLPELSWDADSCIGCGKCVDACPRDAISKSNESFIDRDRCDACFECVASCPSGAMSRLGARTPLNEIMKTIKKDIPFFRTSGGGVTLSGGEPMLYMDFCSALLDECKSLGINTLLETCAQFDFFTFNELIYKKLDALYVDVKLIDSGEHKKHCGVPNDRILRNIKLLGEMQSDGGVPTLPRVPLIPGVTATDENLSGIAEFLAECGFNKVSLLNYNPLWTKKCAMIGTPAISGYEEKSWLTDAELKRCRAHFDGFEIV